MMEERNFKGVFIPASLYLNKKLSWTEKFIIIEIDSLTTDIEYCSATNKHFSELLGVSRDRVSRIISGLIEKGYIFSKIIYKDGTKQIEKRYLYINWKMV